MGNIIQKAIAADVVAAGLFSLEVESLTWMMVVEGCG